MSQLEQQIDDGTRTSPIGLWTYARVYCETGEHVAALGVRYLAPAYFLYSHAIELVFKAHLRAHDASLEELQRLGHRLPLLLDCARQWGLDEGTFSATNTALINWLYEYHKDNEFRQIVTGYKSLPDLAAVHDATQRLLAATRAVCWPRPS